MTGPTAGIPGLEGAAALDLLPGLAWLADERGHCTFLNREWETFTGRRPEGDEWLENIHPEDRARVRSAWADAARRAAPFAEEFRVRRIDGVHVRFRAQGRPTAPTAGIPALLGVAVETGPEAPASTAGSWVAWQRVEPPRAEREAKRAHEERYRLLTLATHDVLWDWDLTTGRLSWNEAVETTLGYGWADVREDLAWWQEHIHPDDRPRVIEAVAAVVDDPAERFWAAEYRFRHHDGRWLDVLDRGFVARDDRGRAVRMIGSMLDLTERKRAEDALRRSEAQFRNLADAMPQMVWITRADGFHEYFNRQWYEYTGTSFEASRGDRWLRYLHPDDVARTQNRWIHSMETGDTFEVEYRFRRAGDGVYSWFLGRGLPVRDEAGRIVRWFGTCTNIQDRKQAEEDLEEARTRLEVILGSLPVGVFIADENGRILETNERGRKLLGAPEVARSRHAEYRALWPTTQLPLRDEDRPLIRAIRRGETVTDVELEIDRLDGRRATILTNAAPFRDRGGRITGAVGIALDVTERKRAEAALRESEARARDRYAELEQIYRYAPVGLFTFDREYRFQRINERMAQINGIPVEAHLGKSMDEVVPALAEDLRRVFRPVFERGEAVLDVELHGSTAEAPDAERDWLGSYFPLRTATGEIVGLVGAVQEVTERKKTDRVLRASEERLRNAVERADEANERLREVDRRKDEFLAMLSHELRNPLAPIRHAVHLLGRLATVDDREARALAVVDRQVVHLTRLIDDLLDVTRIARGKVRLQRQRLELGDLVRRTAEDHREIFGRGDVALKVRVNPSPLPVFGDATRLSQIVGNLLANAAKFTPPGGHVEVSAERGDGEALIRVRDDGAGIGPELAKRLFDPFVQADQTLDRSQGGLGLGLALVRGLAEMHGGSVAVKSAGPGRGSVFTVHLPLAAEAHVAAPAETPADRGAHQRRVLVVEDNVDAAETLRDVLELDGHRVAVAGSGPEALAVARAFRPDVIFCDIGLPGMDGYEVARSLRADPELRGGYLVALSGYAAAEDVDRALAAGFDEHLAKPADLSAVEAAVDRAPGGGSASGAARDSAGSEGARVLDAVGTAELDADRSP